MIHKRFLILLFSIPLFHGCAGEGSGGGVGSNTVNITLTPPTTRADDSPLAGNDISKYLVRYQNTPYNWSNSAFTASGSSSLQIQGVPDGTWYFVVHTIDTDGITGPPSEVYSITLP